MREGADVRPGSGTRAQGERVLPAQRRPVPECAAARSGRLAASDRRPGRQHPLTAMYREFRVACRPPAPLDPFDLAWDFEPQDT